MLQSIDNFLGAYVANIGGIRGAILQFEDHTPDDVKNSLPDRGLAEDGRVFVPQYEIDRVIADLVAQKHILEGLPGKDILGQAVDDLNKLDQDDADS